MTGLSEPGDFLPGDFLGAPARVPGTAATTERVVERVGPAWVAAVAEVPHDDLAAIAERWVARLEADHGLPVPAEDVALVRVFAGSLVGLCRAAADARVTFAWGL